MLLRWVCSAGASQIAALPNVKADPAMLASASPAIHSASPPHLLCVQARLPELEELQRMMARTHEEMSDLSFQMNEEKATAAARQQDLAQQLEVSQQQCTVRHWLMG